MALQGRYITLGGPAGLFYTRSSGLFWEERRAPAGSDIERFSFTSPSTGWAGQLDGPTLATTDAGTTWSIYEHGIRDYTAGVAGMMAVGMVRPGYGFLAGGAGFILRLEDSAVIGVEWGRNPRTKSSDELEIVVDRVGEIVRVVENRGNAAYSVFNMLGCRVARSDRSASDSKVIDISGLPSGTYLIVDDKRKSSRVFSIVR